MTAPAILSWTESGRLENLADPASLAINFAWIAATLSGLARFNNKQAGPPLSVAQHCVQGADALWRETGDSHVAALFLLHDAHEAWLGDITTPVQQLLVHTIEQRLPCAYRGSDRVKGAFSAIKGAFDRAIYAAAGLPSPNLWNPEQKLAVADMDHRMANAEGLELFGKALWADLDPPKLTGSVCPPWAPMKAEEAFNERLKKYCGIDVRRNPRGPNT